ncbi:apolipoprotein D [Tetranychus urticae]|uniref:Lipocalin/cytosolic fatty-acid binding domain-containing protein n=1 Tax=Tetranychus urticae TaxID=32264 RepID=T1JXH4_TETUR|nr:apolipoprotein D [Tetranychus urticae]
MLPTFILLTLLSSSYGHILRMGDCPDVEVMRNFDMDKFLGKWFVLQKFRTMSNCMAEEITKDENGDYHISEFLVPLGVQIHQRGKVEFAKNEPKSAMRVDYPITTPLGSQNYWVLDTDYTSYAAVWSCQKILFGHRQSAQIMSRTSDLPKEKIRELRQKFESYGINEHDFSFIDQKKCESNDNKRSSINETNCTGCIKNSNFAMKVGPVRILTKRRR